MMAILALMYLAAFAGAEVVAALAHPLWAIMLHFVLLFGLIVASTKAGKRWSRGLFLALGLVPLIRIVSLSVPSADIWQPYSILIASYPLILGVFAIVRILNRRPAEIGLSIRAIPLQIMIAVCGIGIGVLDYVILKPDAFISALSWHAVLLPALILLVATGFTEELIFRGVIQHEAEVLGPWGWVYAAAVSSVLQIGHHSVAHWAVALAMALLFGWVVKRGGSILGVSLSHGLINIGLYLVFPFII